MRCQGPPLIRCGERCLSLFDVPDASRQQPDRFQIALLPDRRGDLHQADLSARGRRMNHPAIAEIQADMQAAAVFETIEQQIAWLGLT